MLFDAGKVLGNALHFEFFVEVLVEGFSRRWMGSSSLCMLDTASVASFTHGIARILFKRHKDSSKVAHWVIEAGLDSNWNISRRPASKPLPTSWFWAMRLATSVVFPSRRECSCLKKSWWVKLSSRSPSCLLYCRSKLLTTLKNRPSHVAHQMLDIPHRT